MMSSGTISVRIGMLPEMNTTEPYSQRLAQRRAETRDQGGNNSSKEPA